MAIYHYSAQVISRSQGRSAVAAIAYRTGTKLTDDRTGLIHDYTKKRGIAHVEILAPANAPEWVYHREILWNQVEAAEKRKDSQVAFEVNLALPVELTEDQNIKLLRAFIQQQFVDKGFIADFAIHLDDPQNPHAHILRSTRPLDGDHFGKKPKAENWLTRKESLQLERIAWADQVNQALEKAGSDSRIDYRSLKDQGVEDRLPQIHLGVTVAGILERAEEQGKEVSHPRLDRFNEIEKYNTTAAELIAELQIVDQSLAQEKALLEALFTQDEEPAVLQPEEIEAETITVPLIPQQVKAVVQSKAVEQRHEEIATEMLKTAAAALSFAKQTSYEGDLYKLELKGQTLSITAKDGRGLLVSRQGDRLVIYSPPTEADLVHFREQRRRLDQAAAQAQVEKRNSR